MLPQYDAVIAITSGTRDMASVMNLVWDRLVPALKAEALAADAAAHKALTTKLSTLTLRPQASSTVSAVSKTVAGRRYTFAENPRNIEALTLDASEPQRATVTLRMAGS